MKLPWSSITGLFWLLFPFILLFIGGFVTEVCEKWDRDNMEIKWRESNDKYRD